MNDPIDPICKNIIYSGNTKDTLTHLYLHF